MKFLLTNDDGIDAPGIAALEKAASQLGEAVISAPTLALSGCSHRVTTDEPFRVERRGARYAVAGTPADCVRVGLYRLAPDADWVLSGINHGANLGADVYHSGTVAAVREAVLHGWPGIALSHYRKAGMPIDWDWAAPAIIPVIRKIISRPRERGVFWNVNLPHVQQGDPEPEVVLCPLDTTPLPLGYKEDGELLSYSGEYHLRSRDPGSDVEVCFSGKIAVSRISLY